MCGIVVVVSESKVSLPFDPILPRGPDGFNLRRVSEKPCVVMGHSRLVTHETSTEQPLQAMAGAVAPGCRLHLNVELQVLIRVPLLSHDALLLFLPDER